MQVIIVYTYAYDKVSNRTLKTVNGKVTGLHCEVQL